MPRSLKSRPVSDSATAPANAIHLHPTAPLAERVLLPGDPGRALALAQALLQRPLMFNHNRGLWGYTGEAGDGHPLTIQATGMGGPSAAIVLSELIAMGARRAIRVGTCGALATGLALGELVIARDAISADGTSRALGARERIAADTALTESLVRSAPGAHAGTILSVDLFYEPDGAREKDPPGAIAIEMEAAALFAVGAAARVPVACVLAISDTFGEHGERTRIEADPLRAAAERMGAVALACARRLTASAGESAPLRLCVSLWLSPLWLCCAPVSLWRVLLSPLSLSRLSLCPRLSLSPVSLWRRFWLWPLLLCRRLSLCPLLLCSRLSLCPLSLCSRLLLCRLSLCSLLSLWSLSLCSRLSLSQVLLCSCVWLSPVCCGSVWRPPRRPAPGACRPVGACR
jgi:uridine phosphorylase